MGAAKKLTAKRVDAKLLSRYLPFQSIELEDLKALASKCQLVSFPSNRVLFRRGDNDRRTYFLVTGEIEISSRQIGMLRLKAGTEAARDAIADVIPRRVEMRTTQPSTFLVIDRHLLEVMMDSDLLANYQVSEMETEDSNDWMTQFLGSLNTRKVPPQNIQALLLRMKELIVRPGQIIVRQNETDSYYYIIKEGRCAVTRHTSELGEVTLAELGVGTGFGEEAIITNGKRNATVTMQEAGVIMRLTRDDFLKLLVRPVVDLVTYPEAEELITNGGRFIDVRSHADRHDYLEGAILAPMVELRERVKKFSPTTTYIVFCGNGQLSAAAAFLLAQHGHEAYVLMGGIERVPPNAKLLQRVRLGSEPETATIMDFPAADALAAAPEPDPRTILKKIALSADTDSGVDAQDYLDQFVGLAHEFSLLRQDVTRNQQEIAWLMERSQTEADGVVAQTPTPPAVLRSDLREVPPATPSDLALQLRTTTAQLNDLQEKYLGLQADVRRLTQVLATFTQAQGSTHPRTAAGNADILHMATGTDSANREDDTYMEAVRSWTTELERQLTKTDALNVKSKPGPSTEAQSQHVQRRFTKKQP